MVLKMKQKTILVLGAICLLIFAVTTIGIGLSNRDTSITMKKDDIAILKERYNAPNVDIQFDDLGCDDERCYFLPYTPNSSILNRVKGNMFSVPRWKNKTVEYTDNEIVAMRDAAGKARLEDIADATRQRQAEDNRTYKDIGGLGKVSDK